MQAAKPALEPTALPRDITAEVLKPIVNEFLPNVLKSQQVSLVDELTYIVALFPFNGS